MLQRSQSSSDRPTGEGESRKDGAQASAVQASLAYVTDTEPGIRRRRAGKGFAYKGPNGRTVNGETFSWKKGDTFSAPNFSLIEHNVTGKDAAFLIRVHDTPLQQKLNYYEERPRPQ